MSEPNQNTAGGPAALSDGGPIRTVAQPTLPATRARSRAATPGWVSNWLARLELREEDEPIDLKKLAMAAGASLIAHLLILSVLLVVVVSTHKSGEQTIVGETAGSPWGSELSDQPLGGLGFDTTNLAEPPPESKGLDSIETLAIAPADQGNFRAAAPKTEGVAGGSGLVPAGGQAGKGDGFGVARFGRGTELIRGVKVKVGNPQFTLIWDTDVDLDLHVIEPGGSEIFFDKRKGDQGGELDVDDVDGFGPENVNYDEGRGQGPEGVYRWHVVYYGGFGGRNVATNWKVRVKSDGNANVYDGRFTFVGQKSREHLLKVTHREGAASSPEVTTSATSAWHVLAPEGAPFEVRWPSEPKEEPVALDGAAVERAWLLESKDGRLRLAEGSAKDRPLGGFSEWLEKRALAQLGRPDATVVEARPVAFSTVSGVELSIKFADDQFGRVRAYALHDRLVYLNAVGSREFVNGPIAREFLDSIREVAPSVAPK